MLFRSPLLGRAAYLEMKTLLSPYLLSHQGDRMAMAHGVEGRFPFLDHRLYEFAMALPARSKLRVTHMREKDILRRWSRGVVPTQVIDRPKQPYRAPDSPSFFGVDAPDYVEELLDPAVVDRVGVFDGRAVSGLVQRCRSGAAQGVRENQALVAILSTQLWWRRFIDPPKTGAAYSLSLQSADVALQDETGILA